MELIKSKTKISIFVSSAGRRIELIECLRRSGAILGLNIRIIAGDHRPSLSAACKIADVAVQLPRCSAPEFIPRLLEVCLANRVDLLIPTIDTELPVLAKNRDQFAKAGVTLILSETGVIEIARDKEMTSRVLAAFGVNTPITVSGDGFRNGDLSGVEKLIIKPRGGSSSVGIVTPRSREEALLALSNDSTAIVQEFWVGAEYTVNLFFDSGGQLRCAIPHRRIETRAGEVSKGRTEDVDVLRGAARKVAAALPGARGPICFQAIIRSSGEYAVFEINARFGGGYPLAHQAGATFTHWLLEEAAGMPCSASDAWRAGVTMLRYDAAVFTED